MDDNERVMDVVRVMRKETFWANGERRHDVERYVREYADRIEAAWKRESKELRLEAASAKEDRNRVAVRMRYEFTAKCKECKAAHSREVDDALNMGALAVEKDIPVNTAALRSALEDTQDLLKHFTRNGGMLADAFALHMRDNDAALAAPARNCDRFTNLDEARNAFYQIYFGPTESEFLDDAFEKWLFDKAEDGALTNGSVGGQEGGSAQ